MPGGGDDGGGAAQGGGCGLAQGLWRFGCIARAWQEWEPERIEIGGAVESRGIASQSRMAIFKHQSQKDRAMYPGADQREFWQRAEDRNRATAKIYDKLGLAEYEAIEAVCALEGVR